MHIEFVLGLWFMCASCNATDISTAHKHVFGTEVKVSTFVCLKLCSLTAERRGS